VGITVYKSAQYSTHYTDNVGLVVLMVSDNVDKVVVNFCPDFT